MAIDLTLRATDAADMPAIRAVLDAHQVQADGLYLHAPGIDGVFESSYLGSASFYGQLFGITPSPAACSLLFDLAVAGPLIITCEPGPPQIVLCGAGIEPAEVVDESIPPWYLITCRVDNAEELQAVLHGETTPYRVRLADRYWDLTAAPADYRRFL